jgi:voltage-gated potassium channel
VRRRLSLVRSFGLVAVVTGAGVLLGGWLISLLEPERFAGFGEGAWWAIVTITTVGYGDLIPQTGPGRVVGVGLMLLGIAALAFVTATMASLILGEVREEERLIEREESEVVTLLGELNERLERIERAVGAVETSAQAAPRPAPPGPRRGR